MKIATDGFYFRLKGRDFIAVKRKLSGPRKLAVMFHELAHFLFHVPESGATANFHGVGRRTRKEREADIFALCAIIPHSQIEVRSIAELAEDGFPVEMLAARYEIYHRHGF